MGFFHLLIIADLRILIDRIAIENNRTAIKRTRLYLTFFHLELEFFVLDLKVHHSNSMRLIFCHGLPTLQTQILTNPPSLWQFVTKLTYNIMPIYNKMPKYITNPNLRLLTQKLQEKAEGLNQNVPIFPKTLKKSHNACVEIKTDKQQLTNMQ